MGKINSVSDIKFYMKKYNLKFHKGLGQNFLFDKYYLDKIVESSMITKEDTIIEIGPGLGVLTEKLCEKAKKVIAIEIDKDIIAPLSEVLSSYDNIEIINADVLKLNLKELLNGIKNVKVIANLPYYITTPIIMKLLEDELPIESIVIMIQKEVAERLCAMPGTKIYGAITPAVNFYSVPSTLFEVPRTVFIPSPNVDSAVVKLDIRKQKPEVSDKKLLFKIIKAAFLQRRKTLVNALSSVFNKISKNDIRDIIVSTGFSEDIRGEKLSLEDFIKISEKFIEKKEDF